MARRAGTTARNPTPAARRSGREPTGGRYDAQLDRILRCAAQVFADKGYHRASIRDIAQRVGMSLAGLYYYFRSKEELLFLIQDHAFGDILAALERALRGVTDPRQRLHLIVLNHIRYFIRNMAYQKVCAFEQEALGGEYYATVERKRRRYFELVRSVLQELAGERRFLINLGAITLFLFGAMSWIHMCYNPRKDGQAEDMARTLTDLFLLGFLALGASDQGLDALAVRGRPVCLPPGVGA